MKSITLFCGFLALAVAAPSEKTGLVDINTYVIGGTEADKGEFPYLLSVQQIMAGRGVHICGATIYNHRWAISAAHCVYNRMINENYMQVVAGEHSLSTSDGYEQTIGLEAVIIHENFDVITYANDIALLKLKTSLIFNEYVQPANIPVPGFYPKNDCLISGWGATQEEGPSSDTPQKAWLPVISDATCSGYYSGMGIDIISSMICAGYEQGGVDACSKDDGGPLICSRQGNNYLTGISSFGVGCARPYLPGIYTEVSYYTHWIEQNSLA